MKAGLFATLMTVILLLHYIIPYYVTHAPIDAWYWIADSTIAFILTLYYLFRGEQWWRKD
ncbi:MAG: hypothetical protein F7B59_06875 [Desulfurococcales archaeon]|nr:hypothetical protein [Desulfurococcales archaeon]